jgi:hypothetical protein
MDSEKRQDEPTAEQITAWFKRRFGNDFNPTDKQKEWVKTNWGRSEVPNEEWVTTLPPVEKEVNGIKYVLKHGRYGTWASEQALTLKEWAEVLPLDPNEPEWSKRAAKELQELMKYEDDLKKDIVTAQDITPPEWLVEGIFPKNTLNFIAGDAGIGKTLLTLQMSACLISGKPFLGHKSTKSKVLLIERDEPLHLIKEKIDKQSVEFTELQELEIYKGAIRIDENPDKLKLLIYLTKPDVVFIDSFSAIHHKDENSAMEMRSVLDCLRDVTSVFGVTVICIHHFARTYEPKQKGHLRGSTLIEAQSDFALGMDKSKGQLMLRPLKARGVFEPISLMFDKETLTYNVSGKLSEPNKTILRQTRVSELLEAGTSEEEIREIIKSEFSVVGKTVQRDLKKIKS